MSAPQIEAMTPAELRAYYDLPVERQRTVAELLRARQMLTPRGRARLARLLSAEA